MKSIPSNDKNIKSKISSIIMKFHREAYGRGPLNFKVYFINDIIVIKYNGVLSESEKCIAEKLNGAEIIKSYRRMAFESIYDKVKGEIEQILDTTILNIFTDIIPQVDEKVTVITLKDNLQAINI